MSFDLLTFLDYQYCVTCVVLFLFFAVVIYVIEAISKWFEFEMKTHKKKSCASAIKTDIQVSLIVNEFVKFSMFWQICNKMTVMQKHQVVNHH